MCWIPSFVVHLLYLVQQLLDILVQHVLHIILVTTIQLPTQVFIFCLEFGHFLSQCFFCIFAFNTSQ